jgi:hypothetical protein
MNGPASPARPGRHGASSRQDITDPATGGSRLLSSRCATCILRRGDLMHLGGAYLKEIISQALPDSYVVCHDTLTYGDHPGYGPAICRGFFEAYAGQSTALILLQAFRRLIEVPPPGVAGPPGQAIAGQGRPPGADRAAGPAGDTGEEPAPDAG